MAIKAFFKRIPFFQVQPTIVANDDVINTSQNDDLVATIIARLTPIIVQVDLNQNCKNWAAVVAHPHQYPLGMSELRVSNISVPFL